MSVIIYWNLVCPFPFPLLHSPPFPLQVDPLHPAIGDPGERYKLPHRGLGRSPSRNEAWYILALKHNIWYAGDSKVSEFPETQLTYERSGSLVKKEKKYSFYGVIHNDFSKKWGHYSRGVGLGLSTDTPD